MVKQTALLGAIALSAQFQPLLHAEAAPAVVEQPKFRANACIPPVKPNSEDFKLQTHETPTPEQLKDEKNPLAVIIKAAKLAKGDLKDKKQVDSLCDLLSPSLAKSAKKRADVLGADTMPLFLGLRDMDFEKPWTYVVQVNDGDAIVVRLKYESFEYKTRNPEDPTGRRFFHFRKNDGKWLICNEKELPKEHQTGAM